MKKLILFICFCFSLNVFSQEQTAHKVRVEIGLNAFMCPNLSMKLKRTLIQRKDQIRDYKVSSDNNSAVFITSNPLICNKDSIIKIFVKESEFPYHILQTIQIDDIEVYKKATTY